MDPEFEAQRTFVPLFRAASIDSDATADNLPGPGRNLGLLFAFLGHKLEKGVNSFASRRGLGTDTSAMPGAAAALPRFDSIDSNATADNLPGPGRNLGRLYVYLGNKFVDSLGRFLARRGHGPDATAQLITRLRRHAERDIRDMYNAYALQTGPALAESEKAKLEKTCMKLVRYSRSKAESTAISACNHIADLALYDPYLKQLLFDCLPSFNTTLVDELRHDLIEDWVGCDVDPLLASSRKALISVTEVGFQKSWSDFYVASTPGGLISSDDKKKWYSCMNSFLSNVGKWFLKDTALSFLGLRHILHYMEITTSYITNVQDDDQWASQSEHLINIMHHLLSILNNWFRFNLLNEVPATAIDWETLEALLGNGGAESEWWTRLRGLLFRGSDFGRFGNTIVEDIEAIFDYENPDCVTQFSHLCQQKGRKWIPPVN